jgi:transformation/transcription domain-associated protein
MRVQYLGKTHNLWHRAALVLEQSAFDSGGLNVQAVKAMNMEYDFEQATTSPQQELLDALCDIYSLLKEEDLFVGLWQKRSKYTETNVALAYEQHGLFENAQLTFEQVTLTFSVCCHTMSFLDLGDMYTQLSVYAGHATGQTGP